MPRFWRKKSKPISAATRDREYHKEFATKIIEQIEKGVAPWQKPWKPGEHVLPENFSTGKAYRGGNSLYLSAVAIDRGYSDNRWGTYKQIKAAGGYVRRGEKGTPARWASSILKKPIKDKQGHPVLDKDGKQTYQHIHLKRPTGRRFTLYNVEQANGLNLPERPEAAPAWQAHDAAERVIRASGTDFRHVAGDRASYNLARDRVTMPDRQQFPDAGGYYMTAMHELGHATGHPNRLNRDTLKDGIKAGRDSRDYAREELRAEISAMMTNTRLGLGHNPRHGAAYVEHWVQHLKEHPEEIRDASSDAQQMSTHLIERGRDLEKSDNQEVTAPASVDAGPKPSREPASQAKTTAVGSRAPEIQREKTGPERTEYRQGERTATITRPGTHKGDSRHLVTMETRARAGKLTAWAKDSDDAHDKARRYTATGVVPTWSEHHPDAAGPRHNTPGPTPERSSSPRADRDDGPGR